MVSEVKGWITTDCGLLYCDITSHQTMTINRRVETMVFTKKRTRRVQEFRFLILVITICVGFSPTPGQAGWLQDNLPKDTAGGKLVNGDWEGLGKMAENSGKQIGEGIKEIVSDPQLLLDMTKLAAQCAPKIVAAVGQDYELVIQDFLANGACTQFNRKCSEHVGELVCPNVDGLRDQIVRVCNDPNVTQAISGSEAAQYCAGTASNAQRGAFSRNDQVFGAQPTAQDMQFAQATSAGNEGEFVKALLQGLKEQGKVPSEQQKRLIDSILQTNERQMAQLLQMHQEEFNKFAALNENQRRDFLAELDKQRDSFEQIITKITDFASQGRILDHETIMELIKGSREEREKIYQQHKAEIDRLVAEYNQKLNAAQAERDAAVKKLQDMTASLNRQLITAHIIYVACSQAIDNYTWCVNIKHQKNPEQCSELKEQKSILCE
jgi:hypothetical protein